MAALPLTSDRRRELRALAHHLDPVVHLGQDGFSAAVRKELDAALAVHGLVKVRVFQDSRELRQTLFDQIADDLGAAAVQHIGKLLVLWRPPAPRERPEPSRSAAPRLVKLVTFSKSGNHRATVRSVKVLGNERISPGGLIKRKATRATSVKKKAGG